MYAEYLSYHAKRLERPAWLQDNELWALIRQTETRLRALIQEQLETKYHEGWSEELEKIVRSLKIKKANGDSVASSTVYEEWTKRRERELYTFRKYPNVPVLPILDYSYIGELGQVISKCWDLFRPVFKDKALVDHSISVVAQVRNPPAHFRDKIIPQNEIERGRVACRDLLLAIQRSMQMGDTLMMEKQDNTESKMEHR
jgi:hypothetical protein